MRTTKDREAWTPPAGSGVFYSHRPNRPSPFLLRWKAGEGQDEGSAAFKDANDRERAAKALVERRQTHGDAILQFDAARWLKYLEFQSIVGPEVDPIIVAHEWRASKQGTPRAVGLLVPEAVAKYMALKVEENAWGADSLRHVTKALADRFAPAFASKRLHDVNADDVRDWLFGKVSKDGKRVGALCDDKGRPLGSYERRRCRMNAAPLTSDEAKAFLRTLEEIQVRLHASLAAAALPDDARQAMQARAAARARGFFTAKEFGAVVGRSDDWVSREIRARTVRTLPGGRPHRIPLTEEERWNRDQTKAGRVCL